MDAALAPLKLRGMPVLNYLADSSSITLRAHRTQGHITRT